MADKADTCQLHLPQQWIYVTPVESTSYDGTCVSKWRILCTKNKPAICKTIVQLTRQRSVSSTTQNPTSTTAVAPAALAAASQLYHPPSAIQYPNTSSTTTTSSKIPIFYRAPMYFDRVAVTDVDGDFTYEDVFRRWAIGVKRNLCVNTSLWYWLRVHISGGTKCV